MAQLQNQTATNPEEEEVPLWKKFGQQVETAPQQPAEPTPEGGEIPLWQKFGQTPAPTPAPTVPVTQEPPVAAPVEQRQPGSEGPTFMQAPTPPVAAPDDLEATTPNQDTPRYLDTTDDARAARSFANTAPRDGLDTPTNSTLNYALPTPELDPSTPEEYEAGIAARAAAIEAAIAAKKSAFDQKGVDLGKLIGSTMWDGYSLDEARQRYEALKERPETSIEPGGGILPFGTSENLVYTSPDGRKEVVPYPTSEIVDVSGIVKGVAQALSPGGVGADEVLRRTIDAFKNPDAKMSKIDVFNLGMEESIIAAGATIGSLVDVATPEKYDQDFAGRISKAGNSIDTGDSLIDSLLADGAPAIVGLGLGGAATKGVITALGFGSKLWARAAILLGSEAAAATTVSTEEGTVMIGDNSKLGWFDGIDMGDSTAATTLEHRFNTLLEGIVIGGAVAGGAKGVRGLFNLAKWATEGFTGPLTNAGLERRVVDEMKTVLTGIGPNSNPLERQAATDRMALIISQNQSVVFEGLKDFMEKGGEVSLDTLSAALTGVRKEGTDATGRVSQDARAEFGRLAQFLKGFSNQFSTVNAATGDVALKLEGVTREMDEAFGGSAGRAQSADIVAGQAGRAVRDLDAPVEQVTQEIADMEDYLIETAMSDPNIGGLLTRMAGEGPMARGMVKTSTRKEMADTIRTTYEAMDTQKNELYGRIKGGEIDGSTFYDAMQKAIPEDFLKSTANVRSFEPIRNMFTKMREFENTVRNMELDETIDQATIPDPKDMFNEWLDNNPVNADFSFFYNKVRPELQQYANKLLTNGNATEAMSAGPIRDLVNFIENDMLDYASFNDPTMRQNVEAAKDFYKNTYAPLFGREGALAEYPPIHNRTVNRGFGDARFNTEVDNLIQGQLSGSPFSAEQLKTVFDASQRPEVIMDYITLDFVEEVTSSINRAGGIENFDYNQLEEFIRPYAETIGQVSPTKAAQLDALILNLRESVGDKVQMEEALKNLVQEAEVGKKAIIDGEVKFFLDSTDLPETIRATSNPDQAFTQMFQAKESVRYVNDYMANADNLDPGSRAIVLEGLRSAYATQLRNTFFGANKEIGLTRPLSQRQTRNAGEADNQIWEIGDTIFAKQPEIMASVKELTALALELTEAKAGKAVASDSSTAITQEAMYSVNKLLNASIGQLSKTSARLRSLARSVFEGKDIEQAALDIQMKFLTDPALAVEMLARHRSSEIDDQLMPDTVRFLTSALSKVEMSESEQREYPMRNAIGDELEKIGGAVDTFLK